MIRMTVEEIADLLSRPRAWVYSALYKMPSVKRVKGLLEFSQLCALVTHQLEVLSYDEINYSLLVDETVLDAVNKSSSLEVVPKVLNRIVDEELLCDVIIAYKLARPSNKMFNVIAYVSKKLKRKPKNLKQFVRNRIIMDVRSRGVIALSQHLWKASQPWSGAAYEFADTYIMTLKLLDLKKV